jgi:hypothetical protein
MTLGIFPPMSAGALRAAARDINRSFLQAIFHSAAVGLNTAGANEPQRRGRLQKRAIR